MEKNVGFHVRITWKVLIVLIAILLFLSGVAYLFWPFDYSLTIANTKGDEILTNVLITESDGGIVFSDYTSSLDIRLWKGNYTIHLEAEGYAIQEELLVNKVGFKQNKDLVETRTLQPVMLRVSSFAFTDPTTTLELSPMLYAKGINILGDTVNQELGPEQELMYGNYIITVYDKNFARDAEIHGDRIFLYGEPQNMLLLEPNDNFLRLEPKEVEYVFNYISDFLEYSEHLASDDRGLPKQFYIYSKDHVMSLGDMLFLVCLKGAYVGPGADYQYYMPKWKEYTLGELAHNHTDCYASALNGTIPGMVENGGSDAQVFELLKAAAISSVKPLELNTKKRGPDIAFTFDIEAGRYVWEDNGLSIGPCESADYSLGLKDDEIVCDDPAYVAWMTPTTGETTYTQYPYPQVSNLLGYEQILDYSERYGIPTTNYIVKKDLLAIQKLDQSLIDRTNVLIGDGLFEVGSHTRYHTHLGVVEPAIARAEIRKSKEFLEEYFDTSVYGIRAPYLSKIGDEDNHADEVQKAGYAYYSSVGENFGKVRGKGLVHKPYSGEPYLAYDNPIDFRHKVNTYSYLITLDHPWNLVYDEVEEEEYKLRENPGLLDNHRALILTAISNGGILVLAKDLRLYKGFTY
ncbi:MAG: polysaccharide deacetylase family protein [Nanoarchaeota archaeon]|nr:polysaccharide deacetylase family protein [Nanoarchaeota archaeon]